MTAAAIARLERDETPTASAARIAWWGVWLALTLGNAFSLFGADRRDYTAYLDYFNTLPPNLSFEDARFEPGFQFVSWFFAILLEQRYEMLLLVVAGFALGIKMFLFRRYLAHPWLALGFYLLLFYPAQEYTQIRAALAIGLTYLAGHLALERRWIWAALLVVVAMNFHASILILVAALLIAPLLGINLPTAAMAGTVAVVLLGSLLRLDVLLNVLANLFSSINPLVRNYVENVDAEAAIRLTSVNNLLLLAFLLSAIGVGWLGDGRYRRVFLLVGCFSIPVLLIFAGSPVIAQRSRDVLMVGLIFATFRLPLRLKDMLPVGFLALEALLLAYLAVDAGIILR